MPVNLTLKDYLDTSTESSNRIRNTVVILIFVTVLVLAGNLNSAIWAWSFNRIDSRLVQNKALEEKVKRFECGVAGKEWKDENRCELFSPASTVAPLEVGVVATGSLNEEKVSCGGAEDCDKETWDSCKLPNGGYDINCHKREKLACYKCAKEDSAAMLMQLRRSLVDTSYSIRAPFFGVSFDINDLSLIGGLSLIIVLTMLRLSLRNYIISLRIGFKAASHLEQKDEFYDILASRQLFVFPPLYDDKQDPYKGKTESAWERSVIRKVYYFFGGILERIIGILLLIPAKIYYRVILFSSQDSSENTPENVTEDELTKNGWHANPQLWLKFVPKFICLIPVFVYSLVVINDYKTLNFGFLADFGRAISGFILSIFFLLIILGLGCWCISKWYEIDWLWEDFKKPNPTYND